MKEDLKFRHESIKNSTADKVAEVKENTSKQLDTLKSKVSSTETKEN